jgi:hypothetical protein
MNKYRTSDGKLFIDLKKGYTIWRRYFNKIPYKKYPISEVISDEDYNTSIRSLINIVERSGIISLVDFTKFSDNEHAENYYCEDYPYSLALAKYYESYYMILELGINKDGVSTMVYKNKSEILNFITQHFNYEMPDT